jgi:hypothetical protein
MAKLKLLTEQEMSEARNRFKTLANFEPDKTLLEYSFVNKESDLLLDEGPDDDPNAINGKDSSPNQSQMGGEQAPMEAQPSMGSEQAPMEAQPSMGSEQAPMEAQPSTGSEQPPMEAQPEGGEVEVDVTDLTKKQDDIDAKVSSVSSETLNMMDMLSKLTSKLEDIVSKSDAEMAKIKAEIIKRNPTPVEVLQKRITVSDPFSQTPVDYWKKKEAEGHYKLSDENEDELELKGSDIDSNASEIYKSFGLTDDEMNQSLATIFRH